MWLASLWLLMAAFPWGTFGRFFRRFECDSCSVCCLSGFVLYAKSVGMAFCFSFFQPSTRRCSYCDGSKCNSHILLVSFASQNARLTCTSHIFRRSLSRGKRNIRCPFRLDPVHSGTQHPVIVDDDRHTTIRKLREKWFRMRKGKVAAMLCSP